MQMIECKARQDKAAKVVKSKSADDTVVSQCDLSMAIVKLLKVRNATSPLLHFEIQSPTLWRMSLCLRFVEEITCRADGKVVTPGCARQVTSHRPL
jgi:hypothetical protein